MKKKKVLFLIVLSIAFSIMLCSCSIMTVRHVNPDEPYALKNDERVVFGRVIFITHSEEMGEVRFPPFGLGLVHAETERRARRAEILERTSTIVSPSPSDERINREVSTKRPWFENDGTFFWILPTGSYQIDALGWGFQMKVSAQDLKKQRKEQVFSLKPDNPPECGFVVSPNMVFNVSGESGALYIGSLFIDMDIRTEHGIEIKNINRIEIKDEYAEAIELLKSRYHSYALTVEKRLITSIPDRPVSVANRRCPTWAEMFFRVIVGAAIQFGPLFIPVVPGVGTGIVIPSFGH